MGATNFGWTSVSFLAHCSHQLERFLRRGVLRIIEPLRYYCPDVPRPLAPFTPWCALAPLKRRIILPFPLLFPSSVPSHMKNHPPFPLLRPPLTRRTPWCSQTASGIAGTVYSGMSSGTPHRTCGRTCLIGCLKAYIGRIWGFSRCVRCIYGVYTCITHVNRCNKYSNEGV